MIYPKQKFSIGQAVVINSQNSVYNGLLAVVLDKRRSIYAGDYVNEVQLHVDGCNRPMWFFEKEVM